MTLLNRNRSNRGIMFGEYSGRSTPSLECDGAMGTFEYQTQCFAHRIVEDIVIGVSNTMSDLTNLTTVSTTSSGISWGRTTILATATVSEYSTTGYGGHI